MCLKKSSIGNFTALFYFGCVAILIPMIVISSRTPSDPTLPPVILEEPTLVDWQPEKKFKVIGIQVIPNLNCDRVIVEREGDKILFSGIAIKKMKPRQEARLLKIEIVVTEGGPSRSMFFVDRK